MNTKTLHVVSGLSDKCLLRAALNRLNIEDEIMDLPIDLSWGYIPKNFTDKELCFALASHNRINDFDQLKDFIAKDFSAYERIIVWHGWSASNQLLLYLMSVLVENNLYHITITDCPEFRAKHSSAPFISMGHVCGNDIIEYNMLSCAKAVTSTERNKFVAEWNRWKESKTPYRFSDVHTGVIKEYPADFMDDSILDIVENQTNWHLLLAVVMEKYSDYEMGDSVIFNRLLELWEQRKIILSFSLTASEDDNKGS